MLSKILANKLHSLLDNGKYNEARKLVYANIEKFKGKSSKSAILKVAELYGFLIDIGCGSLDTTDLIKAVDFLEKSESEIGQYLNKQSFYYNLANAKHGLSRAYYVSNRGVPSLKAIAETFQPPINYYWLAYKNLTTDEEGDLKHQILINFANSLNDAGRIIECIQFLNYVLRERPNFPQALISKADAVQYLSQVTNCSYSVSLFYEIYKSYDAGINTNKLPKPLLIRCLSHREDAKNVIKKNGFDVAKLDEEEKETEMEFNAHSEYRKFCLSNFLSLNEHAIYCGCVSAEKDDLCIGVPFAKFKGEIVPKLELLLNRLKSEFSLARWLYYQSKQLDIPKDDTVLYSELFDGEVVSPQSEMLRTSFRICYGVLDKIALGLCKIYNLNEMGDYIYFERFWNPGKKFDRWEKLNKIKNIHLNALYSIACDLNSVNGELKHFKTWRNKLEHNAFIMQGAGHSAKDIFRLYQDTDFFYVVDENDFKDKTLHLLQLTRSAIFSFVYCIRLETIVKLDEKDDSVKIYFKN